ncbi:MAG: hypothetical protein AAGG48_14450 [Planctomycetota bacterium]
MPKPVLQAMVLADHVYQDRVTNKFVIAGTFSNINFHTLPQEPTEGKGKEKKVPVGPRMGSPFLYIALAEVYAKTQLSLQFVDLSDAKVLMDGKVEIGSDDPTKVVECAIELPLLPITRPDVSATYSLDLIFEGEILGSWRIKAQELASKANDKE